MNSPLFVRVGKYTLETLAIKKNGTSVSLSHKKKSVPENIEFLTLTVNT